MPIAVVSTDNMLTGVREVAYRQPPRAWANAFAALTGTRLRELPMARARVKAVLARKG
jgi:CO/xanthine dehydrogenase Mo-binding subunit